MKRPDLLKGESLLPAPTQSRSRDKRERIKQAALDLFGKNGYERTSIDEIAARAKLAVGGFYQHFRSKRQLLLVLMSELLERLGGLDLRPHSSGNIQEALGTFLREGFNAERPFSGAYRAWQEAVVTDPDLASKDRMIHAWSEARVFMAFSLLQQLPHTRRNTDLKSLAQVMDGFFWSLLARGGGFSRKQSNAWIDATAHLIFHALFID
jgi:AcrR family transcriptional regulator